MTESTQVTLLRRMTRSQGQEAADSPLTSSRAVRLALTKAANDTVGLVLTVLSVAEEVTGLDDMLGTLGDDLMLIALERDNGLAGLICLDMELRAAILEMETMGALLGQKAEDRAPTRTDKTLCDPLLVDFLAAFPAAVLGTPLEGWMDGVTPAERMDSTRAAGLVLADCDYRIVRMSVDLGVADRQGLLVIVLPLVAENEVQDVPAPVSVDWDTTFHKAVSDAPACMDALLHRFKIPLATARALEVGSVLPLPGCTVNSVRLLAPDGKEVAQAKLGQVSGYRAVRLEAAPAPQLSDLPAPVNGSPVAITDSNVIDQDMNGGLDLPGGLPDMPGQTLDGEEPAFMTDDMPAMADMSFDPETLVL